MSKGIFVALEYHRMSANSKRVLGELSTTSFILGSATSAHRTHNTQTAGSEESAED